MTDTSGLDILQPDQPKNGFTTVDHEAQDVLLAAAFNPSGTRIATCSADHRIRVYDIGANDHWSVVDQWRGHDAEVSEVKWVGASLGQVFGTIGGDSRFKVWREDTFQAKAGGRRFKCIHSQSPSNHVSYVALDIKTVKLQVWVALMSHDGLLSLLEPTEAETLATWNEVDAIYPFGQHSRSAEPRFRVSFHQAERPSYDAVTAGLDPKALSLAVSSADTVKLLRASQGSDGNYQFYEVISHRISNVIINDVAWAPGCIRPYDFIAVACDDGTVRVLEITTPHDPDPESPEATKRLVIGGPDQRRASTAQNQLSGISTSLAGASRMTISEIKHQCRELASLEHDEGLPVWRVHWTHDGSTLVSMGDSGKLHLWKQDDFGEFAEFAEAGPD